MHIPLAEGVRRQSDEAAAWFLHWPAVKGPLGRPARGVDGVRTGRRRAGRAGAYHRGVAGGGMPAEVRGGGGGDGATLSRPLARPGTP